MKTISKAGINLIKKWEGFRSKPYLCSGNVATIGFGSTYYPNGKRVTLQDKPINEAEAGYMLIIALGRYEKAVNKLVKAVINQNQFDALVSFVYNVGAAAFEQSTLLKVLNAGDYEGAAQQFLRWNKAGGKVVEGLTNRRKDEMALFMG